MGLRSQLFRGDSKLEAAAVSHNSHITPGSIGPHVAKIQRALNILDGANLKEDGNYGPGTAAAVLAYKRKRNIINRSYQTQADNIVGIMTIAALDDELQSRTDPNDLGEYERLFKTALAQLNAQKGDKTRGVAFFLRQKPLLDKIALAGHRVPASGLTRRSLVASPGGSTEIGAVQVGVLVAAAIVILVFAAAMAVVMAQNAKASAQEIARLEREFEIRLSELNRVLQEAPINAVILIAAMMTAVEAAIRVRIAEFQRQMDRCRQISTPEQMTKCLALFNKIAEQMRDILQRAFIQGLETEANRARLLLGLARSMGFLVTLISDWAKCMGCTFLQFL
jgi:hypothetical protein